MPNQGHRGSRDFMLFALEFRQHFRYKTESYGQSSFYSGSKDSRGDMAYNENFMNVLDIVHERLCERKDSSVPVATFERNGGTAARRIVDRS
jgi:hypothetical protein